MRGLVVLVVVLLISVVTLPWWELTVAERGEWSPSLWSVRPELAVGPGASAVVALSCLASRRRSVRVMLASLAALVAALFLGVLRLEFVDVAEARSYLAVEGSVGGSALETGRVDEAIRAIGTGIGMWLVPALTVAVASAAVVLAHGPRRGRIMR